MGGTGPTLLTKEADMATKIKVNTDVKANFRKGSAREAYWEAIKKSNGKTVEHFEKACQDNPPSKPKKGKLKGKLEPTSGWLSWFVRNGYIELAD